MVYIVWSNKITRRPGFVTVSICGPGNPSILPQMRQMEGGVPISLMPKKHSFQSIVCILRIGNCKYKHFSAHFHQILGPGDPKMAKNKQIPEIWCAQWHLPDWTEPLPAKLGLSKPSNIKNGPKIKNLGPPSKNLIVVCPLGCFKCDTLSKKNCNASTTSSRAYIGCFFNWCPPKSSKCQIT